jgi:hypothetical protein
VWRIFLPSFTLCNTASLFTRSVQLIFSILLQHHISKLSRYFRSNFRRVQVSAPYKAMLQSCYIIKKVDVTCKMQEVFPNARNLIKISL